MVSAIDPTVPADGQLVSKQALRDNALAARDEIVALQGQDANVRSALGIALAATLFPDLGGDNTPTGAQDLITILLALDAAITAAGGGGGGGATTLAQITDILDPTEAIRGAFQEPLDGTTQTSNFSFDLGSQGGRFITVDNSLQDITMTLPATSALSARSDGFLCSVVPVSGANDCSIVGPTDSLRFSPGIFGQQSQQTEVFIGLSTARTIRTKMDVYKDGPLYQVIGPGRLAAGDDLAINAPETVDGAAIQTASLVAAAFPALLDFAGAIQAGGARSIVRDVGGGTTLAQADAGKVVRLTGGANATWNVGDLAEGTVIEIRSAAGAGQVTLNHTGALALAGGLNLASGASGALRFFDNELEIVGTT